MKTKNEKRKTYAVLTKDWSYTNMIGEIVTWKKGRRFLLNKNRYFNFHGSLVLENWYGYGADETISADYFAKK